jgi:hypothetical protein
LQWRRCGATSPPLKQLAAADLAAGAERALVCAALGIVYFLYDRKQLKVAARQTRAEAPSCVTKFFERKPERWSSAYPFMGCEICLVKLESV